MQFKSNRSKSLPVHQFSTRFKQESQKFNTNSAQLKSLPYSHKSNVSGNVKINPLCRRNNFFSKSVLSKVEQNVWRGFIPFYRTEKQFQILNSEQRATLLNDLINCEIVHNSQRLKIQITLEGKKASVIGSSLKSRQTCNCDIETVHLYRKKD